MNMYISSFSTPKTEARENLPRAFHGLSRMTVGIKSFWGSLPEGLCNVKNNFDLLPLYRHYPILEHLWRKHSALGATQGTPKVDSLCNHVVKNVKGRLEGHYKDIVYLLSFIGFKHCGRTFIAGIIDCHPRCTDRQWTSRSGHTITIEVIIINGHLHLLLPSCITVSSLENLKNEYCLNIPAKTYADLKRFKLTSALFRHIWSFRIISNPVLLLYGNNTCHYERHYIYHWNVRVIGIILIAINFFHCFIPKLNKWWWHL